jgi:hypothetical protein
MATKLNQIEQRDTSLVLLFDAMDLSEIQLDRVRSSTPFELVVSAKQVQAIFLSSEQNSMKVTIQPTRMEFVEELRTPFEARSHEELRRLLTALPELSVRAFGINYTVFITVDGYASGGQFVRDRFLTKPTGFEQAMGGESATSATRMVFGEPDDYRDIRLTPVDLQSETVVLQYHCHKEASAKDRERVFRLIADRYPTETLLLGKVIASL